MKDKYIKKVYVIYGERHLESEMLELFHNEKEAKNYIRACRDLAKNGMVWFQTHSLEYDSFTLKKEVVKIPKGIKTKVKGV
mgnify:CR=1 FL=1